MAILHKKSAGESVKILQRRLKQLGYDTVGIDGKYGPATIAAVRTLQDKNGLAVDGIAGPETLKALGILERIEQELKKQASAGGVAIGGAVAGNIIVTGDRNVAVDDQGTVIGRDVVITKEISKKVLSQDQAYERIGAAIKLNLDQLEQNIEQARTESSQFFKLTLIFASLGFVVVLAGVALLLAGQVTAGVVSSISGIIPEVTAVLFFKKDKELRGTIERYNQHILDSQSLLTMIDVAETVQSNEERDLIKRQIIHNALDMENTSPNKANSADAKSRAAD